MCQAGVKLAIKGACFGKFEIRKRSLKTEMTKRKGGRRRQRVKLLGVPPFLTLPRGTTKTLLPPSAHSKEEFGGTRKIQLLFSKLEPIII